MTRAEGATNSDPEVDWRRPAGVPTDGVALWNDNTWRDYDASTVQLLRNEVIAKMRAQWGPGVREGSSSSFAAAGLALTAAIGVGMASRKRRRSSR